VFFLIGLFDEIQGLMYADLLGDHVQSKSRMIMRYVQLGVGGLGAIGLALLVHEITKGNPPFSRHSTMIAVSFGFFLLSGLSILAMFEIGQRDQQVQASKPSPKLSLAANIKGILDMFDHAWFRRYMVMRIPLVFVSLSVPFFALIAAEAHHASTRGLTALIVSSASGYLVAAPLWQLVNMKSHRAVMVTGTLMVAITGVVLLTFHYLHIDHDVHLHAAALFVVTVASTGVSSARKLYFLDVAPKAQRVQGAAAVKSIARVTAVVISATLAGIAHLHEVALAIDIIILASLVASVACYRIVVPPAKEPAHS
jgi:hypothetical protein